MTNIKTLTRRKVLFYNVRKVCPTGVQEKVLFKNILKINNEKEGNTSRVYFCGKVSKEVFVYVEADKGTT